MTEPYNPLDKKNLGKSVADALLSVDPVPMESLEPFQGAGIYAIYYIGGFGPYEPLARMNRENPFSMPIYVGSAVPPGGRKGGLGLSTKPHTKLYGRLIKHRQSIEAAVNLDIADFHCRRLIVDDIWIPLGESLMISSFIPLWNRKLDGFGNHDPGKGRYKQLRSQWDVVHPGRVWAEKCAQREETQAQLMEDIESYLRTI